MRSILPVLALMAGCVCGQQNQQKKPDLVEITPDTVIATVNGQNFTAGDLERITQNLNPALRDLAGTDPQAFLEKYALSLTLQNEARKLKLDQSGPYRDQIEATVRQILVDAAVAERTKQEKIAPEQIRKVFKANQSAWRQARVKVIFVSRQGYTNELATGKTTITTPEQAREKVAKVVKLAREGKDFVELAKQFSDDRTTADAGANFPFPIRANATNVPEAMRAPLLAAKVNDIVGPIEHNSGYYLFRVDAVEQPAFDQVKDVIEKELRQAAINKWMGELQKKSTVTLDHDAFWKTFLAANKQEQQQKPGGSR